MTSSRCRSCDAEVSTALATLDMDLCLTCAAALEASTAVSGLIDRKVGRSDARTAAAGARRDVGYTRWPTRASIRERLTVIGNVDE